MQNIFIIYEVEVCKEFANAEEHIIRYVATKYDSAKFELNELYKIFKIKEFTKVSDIEDNQFLYSTRGTNGRIGIKKICI